MGLDLHGFGYVRLLSSNDTKRRSHGCGHGHKPTSVKVNTFFMILWINSTDLQGIPIAFFGLGIISRINIYRETFGSLSFRRQADKSFFVNIL